MSVGVLKQWAQLCVHIHSLRDLVVHVNLDFNP